MKNWKKVKQDNPPTLEQLKEYLTEIFFRKEPREIYLPMTEAQDKHYLEAMKNLTGAYFITKNVPEVNGNTVREVELEHGVKLTITYDPKENDSVDLHNSNS